MRTHLIQRAMWAACLAAVLAPAGCAAQGQTGQVAGILWHEGEVLVSAPKDIETAVKERSPTSGGKMLYGPAVDKMGRTVVYGFALDEDVADAQVIFRYARLHWRASMKASRIDLEMAGPGNAAIRKELAFDDTKGWGSAAAHWRLLSAKVGRLAKGRWTLKLVSQNDAGSINMDGFFVAPADFKIAAEELSSLGLLAINSHGYLGLRSATRVRQTAEPFLWVAAKGFSNPPDGISATLKRPDGSAVKLTGGAKTALEQYGLESYRFDLPQLPDGDYTLEITSASPPCRLIAPLELVGEFMASLGARLQALEAYTAQFRQGDSALKDQCLADFEHIVDYLKSNQDKLTGKAAPVDNPFKAGLAAHEGATTADPLMANMRRALEQAEETMRRLKASQAPYAGRTGEMRRAFVAEAGRRRYVYRMFVPTAYDKKDKVPLVLFLHGGGGDENYWPDMAGGRILEILEKRGCMALMPHWHSRRFGSQWPKDMMQLVDIARKEFPKVDPRRIYVTGISMGGFGTYAMATRYADVFAAACCVSGTGNTAQAERLKGLPLLILQGGADGVVPPGGARKMAARLEELGYPVKLHIFPVYGHGYHPEEYLPLTLDWFDKYSKKD